MRTLISSLCVLLLAVVLSSKATAADRFDLIYVDHAQETWTSGQIGVTQGSWGFALLVNTGTVPITADEISNAHFTATSSYPLASLLPWPEYLSNSAPIAPGVAVGSVLSYNNMLLTQLVPGEVLVNTTPSQVLIYSLTAWGSTRPDDYAGTLHFDLDLTLGGQEVRFPMQIDIVRGAQAGYQCFSVARVSSVAQVVPVVPTTWGKLKSLYR